MKKYEQWMYEFMEGWANLDYERVLASISPECEYYETPLDEPCANIESVKKLWEVVKDNQKDIKYSFQILSGGDKGIINFQMKRTLIPSKIIQEIDGIFEVKLDNSGKCIYFKQWRYIREK